MRWRMALFMILAALLPSRAEDWTVGDKSYRDVTVVRVDQETVTIQYAGGNAKVALADLSPDLQKRFHYARVAPATNPAMSAAPDKIRTTLAKTLARIKGQVIRKIDNGYLVHNFGPPVHPVGGSDSYNTPGRPNRLPEDFYYVVTSKQFLEDDFIDEDVYAAGEYNYINIQGLACTVYRYADSLDVAVSLAK
jgi:hypothetical protein